MVGIGVMGLGEVEGSEVGVIEVRAVSRQERFWIDELCNRNSRENPGGKLRDFLVDVAVRVVGEECERGDGEGGEEDGKGVGGRGIGVEGRSLGG